MDKLQSYTVQLTTLCLLDCCTTLKLDYLEKELHPTIETGREVVQMFNYGRGGTVVIDSEIYSIIEGGSIFPPEEGSHLHYYYLCPPTIFTLGLGFFGTFFLSCKSCINHLLENNTHHLSAA